MQSQTIEAIINANLIDVLIQLFHHKLPKFQYEAVWCITNIAASEDSNHVQKLLDKNIIEHLNGLLD